MKRQLVWVVILGLIGLGTASAQQVTTGSIGGFVVDDTGAVLPGVTVTVSSAQGARTYVTGGNGRFFAPFLTPDRYTVRLELSGFTPVEQENVIVRLGQRVDLSFTMQVGPVAELVQVVGTSPVIDITSTTAGGVLESDVLKRLPVSRSMTGSLFVLPGVSSSGGVGAANPSIGGGSGLENQYVVDGVNISNTGFGGIGSYSIVFGSLGIGVTTDFIQETQVKTAGFEAEYGQATGGVVNVITRSGTNEFHGTIYGYAQPEALEAEHDQIQTINGTVNTTGRQDSDVGISVGGPLVTDQLFFFGVYNPRFQRRTFIAPDGFPLESLGELERKRRIQSYAAKATWQATPSHRLDVSLFGDPSTGLNGIQRASGLLADGLRNSELARYGGNNQAVKWDGILSPNWLIEASFSRADERIEERPELDEHRVTDTTVTPFVRSGGIGFFEINEGRNLQYSVKSTNLFDAGDSGTHQVRYGFLYEDITYDRGLNRTGPTFTLADGTQTVTGASITILPDPVFGEIYRVTRANLRDRNATTQEYLSFFIQDTWQVGRLSVRPGIRYEQQELRGDDVDQLCRVGETRPGRGDGDGAVIPCSFKWDGNWAARIGGVYDLQGNGRSKIFGSWGRFFAKVPNDLAARAMSADASVTRGDYFDAALTQPVPAGTLAAGTTSHFRVAGLHASEIDPDSRSTFKDEFVGGFEFEAMPELNLGVRYIYRDMPRVLEDVGQTTMVEFFANTAAAFQSIEYFITNPDENTSINLGEGRFEKPIHHYHAVEVTANKRLSNNWALVSSYRWSRLEGTFEGFFRNDNGQSDPAITSLYDFPTNDPSYTRVGVPEFGFRGDIRFQGALGEGPLPNDRTHQAKVYSNYIWNDLNVGVGINASSGAPLTTFAANPLYDNSGEIPEGPRGSGVLTVDGLKERTPFRTTLNLHADYTVRLGNQQVILLVDGFNLFNNQDPLNYDYATESSFEVVNPNGPLSATGAQPLNGDVSSFPSFAVPRQIRVGARLEW